MLEEHDRIVLTEDVSSERLKAGDVGTILHVHRDGVAFEVEFLALDGNTAAVATVPAARLRPVTASDLTHGACSGEGRVAGVAAPVTRSRQSFRHPRAGCRSTT